MLTVDGDIDLAVVPELQSALDGVIQGGTINIVLDLADVHYVDSSALGLLVWLDHQLEGSGGKVVLARTDGDVSRILEMSGLLSVAPSLEIDKSVASALKGIDTVDPTAEPVWLEEMSMPADVGSLAVVRERATTMISTLGFADSALFDIKVALGEALANAVRHGTPADCASSISLVLRAYPDRVELDIIDCGAGFDGTHGGSDDLYASGGRGVMFMRALMDDVRFSSAPEGGTVVTLVKLR